MNNSNDRCSKCNAHCCNHVALHIDTPENKNDYETIKWYLLHRNVSVSIDLSGNWLLEFKTPCRHIQPDYSCGDYANRPLICREYPSEDELCEKETDDLPYTHLFNNVDEFQNYLNELKTSQVQKKREKQ